VTGGTLASPSSESWVAGLCVSWGLRVTGGTLASPSSESWVAGLCVSWGFGVTGGTLASPSSLSHGLHFPFVLLGLLGVAHCVEDWSCRVSDSCAGMTIESAAPLDRWIRHAGHPKVLAKLTDSRRWRHLAFALKDWSRRVIRRGLGSHSRAVLGIVVEHETESWVAGLCVSWGLRVTGGTLASPSSLRVMGCWFVWFMGLQSDRRYSGKSFLRV